MRFLADENCDRMIVEALRSAGHDVVFAVEDGSGEEDEDLFRKAYAQDRIVLTDDLDFGRLAERIGQRPPAVILMRMGQLGRKARVMRLLEVLQALGGSFSGQLVLIEPAQVRRRSYSRL